MKRLQLLALALLCGCHGPAKKTETVFEAARSGDVDGLRALVRNKPDLIRATDAGGDTALHIAAAEGQIETATVLLKRDAPVNRMNQGKATPLHLATATGHLEMAVLLIGYNADVNARDSEGRTPLAVAADARQLEIVKVLIAANADVNQADKAGRTPMAIAEANHFDAIATYLGAHHGHK
jgi:ankyrin repeat protein